ncbi:MAG: penicillin-binding protein 1A [gamma proteobacterium symbiont of Bathyaustriella thionipta]|nr:penicillin-binding protein 1A [gamma proteobacterium symbiont of Bathyaustriella thionipta]
MKLLSRLLKLLLSLLFTGTLLGLILIAGIYFWLAPDLPDPAGLRDVQLQVPLRIYSADEALIAEFGEKRRIPVNFSQIPQPMVDAFVSAEDDRFFEHPGVDYQGLLRAAMQLAISGKKRQGGSTITMQVARNFFLSKEKTYIRKLKEIMLALSIEHEMSKQEILQLYLNKIYLGHRAYGVAAAASLYYGKTLQQLDLSEIATIAGLPKAPSTSNPVTNPERARNRRNYVLRRMLELGKIDQSSYDQALAQPVSSYLHLSHSELEAHYVAEMVRDQMVLRYGDNAYTQGYQVHTSIRSLNQQAANRAVRNALIAYTERHGYRGAEAHFDNDILADNDSLSAALDELPTVGGLQPAIITKIDKKQAGARLKDGRNISIPFEQMQWAAGYISVDRKKFKPKKVADVVDIGDLIRVRPIKSKKNGLIWHLSQIPRVEGALLSVDPNDGKTLALSGGFDFYRSKFNRATQAERQPGSGFKPFIYSAALEAGFTAASLINDAPIVLTDSSLEGDWRPQNYSRKFFGPTRMRMALTKSRNLVSIRLLRSTGIKNALKHISQFGFNPDKLPHNLSLALGSGAVTLLQMARGYSVLANGGYLIEPWLIADIRNSDNDLIWQAQPLHACRDCSDNDIQRIEPAEVPADNDSGTEIATATPSDNLLNAPRVVAADNIYIMNSMMRDVIQFGTGRRATTLGRKDLAGKTGTTNDQRDAWFSGFARNLVTIAWVGFDTPQKLGRRETGGHAALPAWIDYMRVALKESPPDPLPMPANIVTLKIDRKTAEHAGPGQKNAFFEIFREGHQPQVGNGETSNAIGNIEEPGNNASQPDIF